MNITKEQFIEFLVKNKVVICNTLYKKNNPICKFINNNSVGKFSWSENYYFVDNQTGLINSCNNPYNIPRHLTTYLDEKELLNRLEREFPNLKTKTLRLYL